MSRLPGLFDTTLLISAALSTAVPALAASMPAAPAPSARPTIAASRPTLSRQAASGPTAEPKPVRSAVVEIPVRMAAGQPPIRIRFDQNANPTVSVFSGSQFLWKGVPHKWHPWKLTTAEVDGDGRREIAIGVYKTTRYLPWLHNCLFLFDWDGSQATRKWLGSSLGQPFTDFAFADLERKGRDQLIAAERTREGTNCITVYSWNGFGFTADWQSRTWRTLRLLRADRRGIWVLADNQRTRLTVTHDP